MLKAVWPRKWVVLVLAGTIGLKLPVNMALVVRVEVSDGSVVVSASSSVVSAAWTATGPVFRFGGP